MKKIKIVIIAILLICGCEDGPTLINPPLNIDTGESRIDTLIAVADTFIVKGKIYNGESSKLLLGCYQNFSSRFLLKFSILPSDTFMVDSAQLLLKAKTNFGNAVGSFQGNIYFVREEWDDSVNVNPDWDFFEDKIDPSALVTFEISPSDTIFSIELPSSIINLWQDTTDEVQNFGLLFDYSSANFIKEFSSSENGTNYPKLRLVQKITDDSTVIDTISSYSNGQDASLVNYEGNLFEQGTTNIFISSGFAVHSFIKFNFDPIPENAIVFSANFILSKDPETSIINENKSLFILIDNITSDYQDLNSGNFQLDSTLYYDLYLNQENGNKLYMESDIQKNNCRYVMQKIINKETEHGSFYLKHYNEDSDISLYSIKRFNDTDVSLRPKLIIKYYLHDKVRI
jgi:hypothetical protein